MRRKLFTLAAGVSAGLCAGVCVLWGRSYKSPDRFSGLRGGDRYTLVSAGGRLTLYAPPPAAADPAARRYAADLVGGVRNDQIQWLGYLPNTATDYPAMTVETVEPDFPRYRSP